MDHIKLTEVIIRDHFLQRETVVRSSIHELIQLAQFMLRNQMMNR